MKKTHVTYLAVFVGLIVVSYVFLPELFPLSSITPINDQTPTLTEAEKNMSVEEYVKQNISVLSPEKEQVGGTFFVTNIEATSGTGTVSYEDGHNAYTADFVYTLNELGEPSVSSFIIRK